MNIYPLFFKVVFSRMDPERAHEIGFRMIRLAESTGVSSVLRRLTAPHPSLETEAFGVRFPSPFGLAAGFDKTGAGVSALADLGFGHIEVGTVTAQPQPGNPAPRLFRLVKDRAVINRMGFNNDGAEAVARRLAPLKEALERRFPRARPVVGINIGKTKVVALEDAVEDYRASARRLAPLADYMVVNVSSPNTPGLRQLQSVEALEPILRAVQEEATAAAGRDMPLLVKIAPDLADDDVAAVARLVTTLGLAGVVATNTTITRDGLTTVAREVEDMGAGGLSGAPLAARSLEVLRLVRAELGEGPAVIAVGGVTSAADVRARLEAGATLVQGYTAFLYEGPFWAWRINRGLARRS
ncbi:quinone-dependent dihydroorotate dehydrogenase [Falsarthrobacter nasiphocae]|uniref:Dihydroorotate dehydrogenase (quinone) n=1 Tax=Falsarthrobacter nasiphocae TaxID=189863 RepID=A0AAE4C476_9MICC|nr:quinone-dependent dihydroorotate dehydrogenase [Falsarthrobacter nasiphocae]MDR6891081.1 dihydroorotate dehydrogenase [Falsarthrobacter nasiphocae]